MRYLLDTNICIQIIRHKPSELLSRLTALSMGDVGLSTITAAELHVGVQKSRDPARNAEALTMFLLPLEIADFGYAAAEAYGRIRAAGGGGHADWTARHADRRSCCQPERHPGHRQRGGVQPRARFAYRELAAMKTEN